VCRKPGVDNGSNELLSPCVIAPPLNPHDVPPRLRGRSVSKPCRSIVEVASDRYFHLAHARIFFWSQDRRRYGACQVRTILRRRDSDLRHRKRVSLREANHRQSIVSVRRRSFDGPDCYLEEVSSGRTVRCLPSEVKLGEIVPFFSLIHVDARTLDRSLVRTTLAQMHAHVVACWLHCPPERRLSVMGDASLRRLGLPGRPRSSGRPDRASSNGSLRPGRLAGSGTVLPSRSSRRRPLGCWQHVCSGSC
jgi:hypothetical protein